jgi:LPS-assembly protein
MNRLASAWLVVLALFLSGVQYGVAHAESIRDARISLIADQVFFDPETKVLTARGNVRIFRGQEILATEALTYDQKNGRITVPGALTIVDGDTLTTRAKSAVLDADLRNGLIRGAEVLIAQQLQIVAEEFHRTDGRFKVLTKTVASSCTVCTKNPTPFWQIRARRIIHDEQERRIYFENATLQFLGVPIFYTPTLRVPDPTVDRATGFLVPRLVNSTALGFGVEIPYYVTLGDHADVTITPHLYSSGSILIDTLYRKRYKHGWIEADLSFTAEDSLTSRSLRSSFSAKGRFQLPSDIYLDFGIEAASDNEFRSDYRIGDYEQDRLTSFVTLRRTRKNSYAALSAVTIQSLRANEIDKDIPLVFPEFYGRRSWNEGVFGGKFGLTAQTVTLSRPGGNRFFRAGMNLDWQKEWTLNSGLKVTAFGELANNLYSTSNYPGFSLSNTTETTPTLSLDFRLPLSRQTKQVTHVIEPRLQLVWSPKDARTNPNEDSVQVEFEENNLFSHNRFPGFDNNERGLRANVGLSYTRYDPSGWNLGVTVGQVVRLDDLGQFSSATGLDGTNSDFVSTFTLSYLNKFDLTNRMLFDNHFNLSKNEAQLTLNFNKLSTYGTYVWLEKDVVAGASDPRHEASLAAVYRRNDYWTYSAEWRHNFVTARPTSGAFGVKYENECVAVNLSLSLQYEGSGIIRPTKEIGLTVEMAGFGNKKRNKRYAKRCAAL